MFKMLSIKYILKIIKFILKNAFFKLIDVKER